MAGPPPGVAEGGVWGTNNFVGPSTQAAACVGFLCFCLPGCLILLCPMDQRDAYKVNGAVYDAEGKRIGGASEVKFEAKMQRE